MAPVIDTSSAPASVRSGQDVESEKPNDVKQSQHLEVSDNEITWTPEEEKALVKKIDLFLMPTIWLMYLLSYMDRTK